MIRRVGSIAFVALALFALTGCQNSGFTLGAHGDRPQWYKGNTHTHTLNSDGDTSPDEVVRWYRTRAYDFLVLSDHNTLTDVTALRALYGQDPAFLLIPGEEVTDAFSGKPIHVNGYDVDSVVPPQGGTSVVDVIQRDVDAIRTAGGVPSLNHPNFFYAVTADEIRQVERMRLFEIYNGHPLVNNNGSATVPGLEAAWDQILSSGVLLYGIAVDDAHVFTKPGDMTVAGPGRGWVAVRAARLSADSILAAMERGDFYASTGIELVTYAVSAAAMTIVVRSDASRIVRVEFIGRNGVLLERVDGARATYRFRGDEGYVRARVVGSDGTRAWTQPERFAP